MDKWWFIMDEGFTSASGQYRLFQIYSSRPISWLSAEEIKRNIAKTKHSKTSNITRKWPNVK